MHGLNEIIRMNDEAAQRACRSPRQLKRVNRLLAMGCTRPRVIGGDKVVVDRPRSSRRGIGYVVVK